MTIVRYALRASRLGVVATTVIGALVGALNAIGYAQLVGGGGPAERAAFAQQMALVAQQLSYLVPPPLELDTLGGYVQWRAFGFLPIVYAAWALIAATGAFRGDEDRGLVEQFLASGASRGRYVLARALAFVPLAALSAALVTLATGLGAIAAGEPLPAQGLAEQATAIAAFAFACFGLGALTAQLAGTGRAVAGLGAVTLLALFALGVQARIGGALEPLRPLSPFALYERTQPLARGGAFDVPATIALAAAGIALLVVAALAFARRDIGSGLILPPRGTAAPLTRPSRDPLLRVPVLARLDLQRLSIVVWALVLAMISAYLVSLTRTLVDALLATPTMRALLARMGVDAYESFVGTVAFGMLGFLVAVYAITHVAGWVAEERDGWLEGLLAAPVSRARVVVERFAALLLATAVVVAAAATVTWLGARSAGIPLEGGDVALAAALLLPLALAFGAVGAALVGWRPRLAVPLLGTVAVAGYFIQQFAPVFEWPSWVRDLSLFELYGMPLTRGARWDGTAALLAVSIVGLALGIVALRRRDLEP